MIVVRVDLHPFGRAEDAESLAMIYVANDGTGSDEIGNYDVIIEEPGGTRRSAKVKGHRRAHGVLPLLRAALVALPD